jgi:hypothetical protein
MDDSINPATTRVSAERWADYCSDFRSDCCDVGPDLILVRLRTSRRVIAMVRFRGDGTKTYAIRPGAHTRFPEDVVNPAFTQEGGTRNA